MKQFLKNLIKKGSSDQGKHSLINKKGECQIHNISAFPNIKAIDHCHTCNLDMCYICSSKHMNRHCDVTWTQQIVNRDKTLKPKNDKNKYFNLGYLAKLNLKGIKCPCGTSLEDSQESGLCAACGTGTCSTKCHDEYAKKTNSCVFHHNFTVDLVGHSLRSLLFRNVNYLVKEGYAQGTPISRTSANFIQGYLGLTKDELYLQRGYRQYGQPNEEILNNLEVYNKQNVDFILFKSRQCQCECSACSPKDKHPVHNCKIHCQSTEGLIMTEIINDERLQQSCDCQCEFCSSGILILKHRKIDCAFHCRNSGFYKETKFSSKH